MLVHLTKSVFKLFKYYFHQCCVEKKNLFHYHKRMVVKIFIFKLYNKIPLQLVTSSLRISATLTHITRTKSKFKFSMLLDSFQP